MEEIYLRGFPKSTNLWGSFDLSCVQNQFLDADTPNYLQNHPPSWLYPLLMIYLQKLNIRIQYIPYIYISHIYPIYIPYISHIYPIYIPYISHIYPIYIPYISHIYPIYSQNNLVLMGYPTTVPPFPPFSFSSRPDNFSLPLGRLRSGRSARMLGTTRFFGGKYHGQTIIIYHIYLILDIIWDDRYLLW